MAWEVELTDQCRDWYWSLTEDVLELEGPNLGRPLVDTLEGTSLPNLKELRVSKGGALRILFAFDPRRTAILLLGGDKSGRWSEWYRDTIPEAERLYAEYLRELEERS